MVSTKKIQTVKEVKKLMGEYQVIGILNMHNLPGRQLHEIRNKIRGKAVIRMVKKRLITIILKEKKLDVLEPYIQGEPALFLSKEDSFKIARVLQNSKSEALAKPGDIAPEDIIIPAGPTNLPPGPAIGELQKIKLPAGVEGDKIVIKKDTVVAKEGEEISAAVADVLSKLKIMPMEIGLNLIAVWENGTVYDKDILFIPEDHYLNEIKLAVGQAFNLSVNAGIVTKETVPLLLSKANAEAKALAEKAGIVSPATIGGLLAKGHSQAKALEKAK